MSTIDNVVNNFECPWCGRDNRDEHLELLITSYSYIKDTKTISQTWWCAKHYRKAR